MIADIKILLYGIDFHYFTETATEPIAFAKIRKDSDLATIPTEQKLFETIQSNYYS
jgi:hypothetical protein